MQADGKKKIVFIEVWLIQFVSNVGTTDSKQ